MWARRPVSRVLCRSHTKACRRGGHSSGPALAGRFSRPTRTARTCDRPAPAREPGRAIPIRSCSRRGLPCRPCRQVRGGLLPHPFTLTRRSTHARRAVCFLWRYPWDRSRRALPAALSLWSPDFPPFPSQGRATARPSGPAPQWAGMTPRSIGSGHRAGRRSRAISRARVSPSATPSTRSGRQCRWKASTMVRVAAS